MSVLIDRPIAAQRAVAEAEVVMSQQTFSAVVDGTLGNGDVLTVAELAGVMAGKRAGELIPLVHPVALTELVVRGTPDRAAGAIRISAEAAATAQAGVDMQALTAAAVAALTIVDMVREDDPAVSIRQVRLVSRSAGEAEPWRRPAAPSPRAPHGSRSAGRITPGQYVPGRTPPKRGAR